MDRRNVVSGAPPARAAGSHPGQVGHLGDRPQTQVLSPHSTGQSTAGGAAPAVADGRLGAAEHLAHGVASGAVPAVSSTVPWLNPPKTRGRASHSKSRS